MAGTIELVADREQDGMRLDVFLATHPDVGSRAAAQRLIEADRVEVEGRPRQKRHRLSAGERVVVHLRPPPDGRAAKAPEPSPVPHEVVYEDEDLIVVDKPAGVVVHPAPAHPTGTLAQALAARAAGGSEPWRPGIVHRLDRDTSGLLVVAKSDRTHRALQGLIRSRLMKREYMALVDGRPGVRTATVEAAIGRDRVDRTLVSTRTDRPREARTHFWELRALPRTTLLGVRLETGRTHQVRVHLAAIRHPVCGDARYGGAACGRRLGLSRQFLHSTSLAFPHPTGGQPVAFRSPLPPELEEALARAADEHS